MGTYLITGGAGFIGSKIASELLQGKNAVVVVDNLRTGTLDNVPREAEFLELDVRDLSGLSRLNQFRFDAVLHLAAQSSGEISHDDPDYDLDTNARGTLNILRWSFERGVRRLLNASSMGVYGQVAEELCPVKESLGLSPLSFYGVTKLAGEGYCRYFMDRGMAITSFRMFNVYGPGQNLENMKQGMVSIYMKFLLDNKPVLVKGSKDRFRDFVYIDDVVRAWVQCTNNHQTYGKTYNLGSGKRVFVHELIRVLLESFEKPPDYPVEFAGSTPADQHGIYADISALQHDTSWKPETSLGQGLRSLAEYYRRRSG